MIAYVKQYLNLTTEDSHYLVETFQLCRICKWNNILLIVEIVFSLPVSNAAVERVFSRINIIKSKSRCSLSEDRLDELVRIAIDGLPLKQWDASLAIKLWWSDKQRSPQSDSENHGVAEDVPALNTGRETDTTFDLGDWDEVFG